MSYVTRQQKDWIEMLYGDQENLSIYLDMLDTFGKLVEKTVLPAEQKTELQRSRNPLEYLKENLEQREQIDRAAIEEMVDEIKNEEKIPGEVYDRIVEFGLPGASFTEELGGVGFPYSVFIAFLETLGKASPSIGVRYAISNTVAEGLRFNHAAGALSEYGEKILKELVAGEKLAAFGLTEASASGSNIMREMTTRAVLSADGTYYRIDGNKMFITNAGTADVYAIFSKTSDDPKQGISLFIVERETRGFGIGQLFEKRIVENSSLGELVLDAVEVPVANLVGKAGYGMRYAVRMLNSGRVTIAALAVGLAQRAFEEYLNIAVEGKKSAGKHLVEYDRTQAKIAEISMEINAARDMTYRAAWLKGRYDADPDNSEFLREYVLEGNGAKLKASLVAQKACDYLIKIGGASSVVKENPVMKHYLDSWLYYFGEAVPEVLENIIAGMEVKKHNMRKGL